MKRIVVLALLATVFVCNDLTARTIIVKVSNVRGDKAMKSTLYAKPVAYSGHLTSTGGEAVAYATVVLLQEGRQKAGTVTDSLGNFAVESQSGSYTLIAQCIGYEPAQKNVILPTTRPDTLVLKASAFSLKEVVVQAQNIVRKADRFVLVVPSASRKDGTELLSEAPNQ